MDRLSSNGPMPDLTYSRSVNKYAGPPSDPHFVPDFPIMGRPQLSIADELELVSACNALMPYLLSPSGPAYPLKGITRARAYPDKQEFGSKMEKPVQLPGVSSFMMSDSPPQSVASSFVPVLLSPPPLPPPGQRVAFPNLIELEDAKPEHRRTFCSVSSGFNGSAYTAGSSHTDATSVMTPDENIKKPSLARTVSAPFQQLSISSIPEIAKADENRSAVSRPSTLSSLRSISLPATSTLPCQPKTCDGILKGKTQTQAYIDHSGDEGEETEAENDDWWQKMTLGCSISAGYPTADTFDVRKTCISDPVETHQTSSVQESFDSSFHSPPSALKAPATVIDPEGVHHVMTEEEEARRRRELQAAVFAKMTTGSIKDHSVRSLSVGSETTAPISPITPSSIDTKFPLFGSQSLSTRSTNDKVKSFHSAAEAALNDDGRYMPMEVITLSSPKPKSFLKKFADFGKKVF